MKYIHGKNRDQVEIISQSLNETASADAEVRLIDLFVDFLLLGASANVGYIFTDFNLRRIFNLISP